MKIKKIDKKNRILYIIGNIDFCKNNNKREFPTFSKNNQCFNNFKNIDFPQLIALPSKVLIAEYQFIPSADGMRQKLIEVIYT